MDEAETGTDGAGDGGAGAAADPEAPEKLFTPEGDFLLIWGLMAAILTLLEFFGGAPPTVLLGGAVAGGVSLAAAAANATRRFRPTVGLYTLIMLGAVVVALVSYDDGALVAAGGFAVVALANGGRVYELGYRDADSLLDREDDATGGADEAGSATGEERDGS